VRIVRGLAFIAACILLSGCAEWFPESNTTLAPESRLPRWFQQPADVSRSDLSVEMLEYLDHGTFVLRNQRTGRQLATIRAQRLNSKPLTLPNSIRADGTVPNYSIMKVGGIVEIVERKRREAVFDISDDPDVRTKLLTMSGHTELLK